MLYRTPAHPWLWLLFLVRNPTSNNNKAIPVRKRRFDFPSREIDWCRASIPRRGVCLSACIRGLMCVLCEFHGPVYTPRAHSDSIHPHDSCFDCRGCLPRADGGGECNCAFVRRLRAWGVIADSLPLTYTLRSANINGIFSLLWRTKLCEKRRSFRCGADGDLLQDMNGDGIIRFLFLIHRAGHLNK